MKNPFLLLGILFLAVPPAPATSEKLDQLLKDSDAAFQSHNYQKAENGYTEAFYECHRSDEKRPIAEKLRELYRVSSLKPLDASINEAITELAKEDRQAQNIKSTGNKYGIQRGPSYPLVQDATATYLLAHEKRYIQSHCEQKMEGFTGITGWSGFVYRRTDMAATTYQISATFDVRGTWGSFPASLIAVLHTTDNDEFQVISNNIFTGEGSSPASGRSYASSRSTGSSFASWAADQQKRNRMIDALDAEQQSIERQINDIHEQQQARARAEEERRNYRPSYFFQGH